MRLIHLSILLFLIACHNKNNQSEALSPELEQLAKSIGDDIASKAQQALGSNLMQHINEHGNE